MDQRELYETWQRNNDRPVWVREAREDLHEHIDVSEDIPDGTPHDVREWVDRYKGTITRQLDPDSGDSDTTEDTEPEAEQ